MPLAHQLRTKATLCNHLILMLPLTLREEEALKLMAEGPRQLAMTPE